MIGALSSRWKNPLMKKKMQRVDGVSLPRLLKEKPGRMRKAIDEVCVTDGKEKFSPVMDSCFFRFWRYFPRDHYEETSKEPGGWA